MKVVVFSHKDIWADAEAPFGYVTDGGFAFQMKAISQLFDQTTLLLPMAPSPKPTTGTIPMVGHHIRVVPLTPIRGRGWRRKLGMILWFLINFRVMWREFRGADGVHAAIPGDVGTFGMMMSDLFRKPLFVRYCGNWMVSNTRMERFWKWYMRRCKRPNQVMLATGGATEPPSPQAPHVHWIFSTSLDREQMAELRGTVKTHPGDAPRIVMVGRQEKAKGTAFLIESLPKLSEAYPQLHLDIIGDGGYLSEFRQLTQRLALNSRVTFWGKLPHPEVIAKLREGHVFGFPTYSSEGFPKVVLEALACGLPVATTHVSALPLVIGQGGGVLMETASTEHCLAALQEILADPVRYEKLSQEALQVASQYSLEAWRDNIGAHLKKAWGPTQS